MANTLFSPRSRMLALLSFFGSTMKAAVLIAPTFFELKPRLALLAPRWLRSTRLVFGAFLALATPVLFAAGSTPPEISHFLLPAGNILTAPALLAWSEAPNAAAYYVYIGTKPGTKDLYDSGETKITAVTRPDLPVNRTLFARINTKIGHQWHFQDAEFVVADPATIREPENDAIIREPAPEFRWAAVPDAQAYRLSIGSAPGREDYFAGRSTTGLHERVKDLPPNTPLHLRLHTRIAGQWAHRDSKVIILREAKPANVMSEGMLQLAANEQLHWASVPNATAYYLKIGTEPGAADLLNSGETTNTSFGVASLPLEKPLHLRLHTRLDGRWYDFDAMVRIHAYAPPPPPPIAHLDLPKNKELQAPARFSWSAAPNASVYSLHIGTELGKSDLYESGETKLTTVTPANLPANRLLFARLHTKIGNQWYSEDSEFFVAAAATLIAPENHATLPEGAIDFRWQLVPEAEAYRLTVGSRPGHDDYFAGRATSGLHEQVEDLPVNATLHIRLSTQIAGRWMHRDSTALILREARLANPATDGVIRLAANEQLVWERVPHATAYYLKVGIKPGDADLLNSGETVDTSFSVAALPPEKLLNARLHTRIEGQWYTNDTPLRVQRPAPRLIEPADGAFLETDTPIFRWKQAPGAKKYRLSIGTASGDASLYTSGEINGTSIRVRDLPINRLLHARLETKYAEGWHGDEIVFTVIRAADFAAPSPDNPVLSPLEPVVWTSVPNAEAYSLHIGSAPGKSDLYESGETELTSTLPPHLRSSRTIYLRVWTKIAGHWFFRSVTVPPAAHLEKPPLETTFDGNRVKFKWSPVKNASHYRLQLWSKPSASDLQDSGSISKTDWTLTPPRNTANVCVRLWTQFDDNWTFTSELFGGETHFLFPAKDQATIDAAAPLEWVAVPFASSYTLSVGRSPGASDVYRNEAIPHLNGLRSIRYFVPQLPPGVPLFATITANGIGREISATASFTATSRSDLAAQSVAAGTWAMKSVRAMADASNVPYPGTRLERVVSRNRRTNALCTDYALVLRDVVNGLGLGRSSILDVCFLPNRYDVHTLTEFTPLGGGKPMIMDPTFNLLAKNRADGSWAASQELIAATRASDWNAIEFITSDSYVGNYYLDYPLLFLNPFLESGEAVSGMPYLEEVPAPAEVRDYYLVQAHENTTVSVTIDGLPRELKCAGPDNLSQVFIATSVKVPEGLKIYRMNRYVFRRPIAQSP